MPTRNFSSQLPDAPTNRDVDNDAPQGLRQEWVDLVYQLLRPLENFDEQHLYHVVSQTLGRQPAGNPYGGFRYAIGRNIGQAEWPRVYDAISRLWEEVPDETREAYLAGVNRILAAYSVAWDLGPDGQLHRVLPIAVQRQIDEGFRELSNPCFASALRVFRDAMAAYDDRPRRDRDACANAMDALESVAKEVFRLPRATFGDVIAEARRRGAMASETLSALQKLYDMSNNHFRHGMTTPFTLTRAEVDFVVISCLAGILLFIRLPQQT